MSSSEKTLPRPVLAWPEEASLIGYEFADLLVTVLNQGHLIAFLGWYVDDSTQGPVWHRLEEGVERDLGVSLIMTLYALWSRGAIDVTARLEARRAGGVVEVGGVVLKAAATTMSGAPPLERELLGLLQNGPLRPRDLVDRLPLPSKKRGIGAWFSSGAPSKAAVGEKGWFAVTSGFYEDAPRRLSEALDMAKSLVALESGTDLTAELEREQREEATHVIETEIFDSLRRRP